MIKKLIEVALPLDKINAASKREKSIRHGHPSSIHLWWARRPLATTRAVIWASLVDDPSSHPELFPTEEDQHKERNRLFQILEELVIWENSNNQETPFLGLHVCPTSSLDVPDEQAVRLVILRTNDTYKRNVKEPAALAAVENILNTRGTSPRVYRNMLAFVAPDRDILVSLQTEVKRLIAWQSIITDAEELNLDGNQNREAQSNLNRSNDTVELRLKETYSWLLVPYIDQFGDMKSIQWEVSSISGGTDSIVTKAARKMIQEEQVITKWAPALLQMSLDDLLWRDSDDISIKKLWEYLSTYCYLPRLSSYGVLEDAIRNGLPSTEFFALAAGYSNDRYIDLKFNKPVLNINASDLLVKITVAMKQIVKEQEQGDGIPGGQGNGGDTPAGFIPGGDNGEDQGDDGSAGEFDEPRIPVNKHFYMTAKLDNVRINRDVNTYVQEIIQHLSSVDGAKVELKLEVEVIAPNGIPNGTVRTVSENCRTLKVEDFGFDD